MSSHNELILRLLQHVGDLRRERDEARAALREALNVISGYDDAEASKEFHATVERWRKAAGMRVILQETKR